jgi:hypothetical protein
MTVGGFSSAKGGHEECNDFQPHRSGVMALVIPFRRYNVQPGAST